MFFFFNFLKFFFPVWLEKHFKILMVWMEVFEIIFLRLNSSAAYNLFFFTLLRALMSRNMTGKSKHYLFYITQADVCQFINLLIEAIT